MVEVTAPATMLEGYKFRAVYEGVQFPVIVVSADVHCRLQTAGSFKPETLYTSYCSVLPFDI